jgi:hypothetical protein
MQEYLVGDITEFIENSMRSPELSSALDPAFVETAILFITCFMSALDHINNIYVRAQLCKVRLTVLQLE